LSEGFPAYSEVFGVGCGFSNPPLLRLSLEEVTMTVAKAKMKYYLI
jgi:hypothetical protein